MKRVFLITFIVASFTGNSQSSIQWSEGIALKLSDFASPGSEIGASVTTIQTGASMDFSFAMTNAEFLFTRNFNSKVNCYFNRKAASLVAPDSTTALRLLKFAQYNFDLAELYARKFRKKLFDQKGAFSNVNFFKPIYDEINQEYTQRNSEAAKRTNLGLDEVELNSLHQEVLSEIQTMSDFCKDCKPPKKKK